MAPTLLEPSVLQYFTSTLWRSDAPPNGAIMSAERSCNRNIGGPQESGGNLGSRICGTSFYNRRHPITAIRPILEPHALTAPAEFMQSDPELLRGALKTRHEGFQQVARPACFGRQPAPPPGDLLPQCRSGVKEFGCGLGVALGTTFRGPAPQLHQVSVAVHGRTISRCGRTGGLHNPYGLK